MPDITQTASTPGQLTAQLAALAHGPYSDADTTAAAGLAAEAVRYLNYATPRGGLTEPATIAAVAAGLATALYRLPQLLYQIRDWISTENTNGRIADDHHRPPQQLTDAARVLLNRAADHTDRLASDLSDIHNLTATLHTAGGPPHRPRESGQAIPPSPGPRRSSGT